MHARAALSFIKMLNLIYYYILFCWLTKFCIIYIRFNELAEFFDKETANTILPPKVLGVIFILSAMLLIVTAPIDLPIIWYHWCVCKFLRLKVLWAWWRLKRISKRFNLPIPDTLEEIRKHL